MLAKLKGCWKGDPRQREADFQNWLNEAEESMKGIADAEISIAVADPSVDDVPLIGISEGFTKLTGYAKKDILGKNCRFLVTGVPREKAIESERTKAREFCQAIQKIAKMENSFESGPEDVCCFQVNCRPDGQLFCNMFLMHFAVFDGKPYIVALQLEMPYDEIELSPAAKVTSQRSHSPGYRQSQFREKRRSHSPGYRQNLTPAQAEARAADRADTAKQNFDTQVKYTGLASSKTSTPELVDHLKGQLKEALSRLST